MSINSLIQTIPSINDENKLVSIILQISKMNCNIKDKKYAIESITNKWYYMKNKTARQLATIIYNYSKLKLTSNLLYQLLDDIQCCYKEFNPQGIANIMYAFGKLNIKPTGDVYDCLMKAIRNNHEKFNPQGIANIMYAFGLLDVKPTGNVYDCLMIAICNKHKELNSQEIANIMYAFGLLDAKPTGDVYGCLMTAICNNHEEFNSQDIANIMYAFGLLDIKPTGNVYDCLMTAIRNNHEKFNPQNIANIMYAFGLLDVKPTGDVYDCLMIAICNNHEKFDTIGKQQILQCKYLFDLDIDDLKINQIIKPTESNLQIEIFNRIQQLYPEYVVEKEYLLLNKLHSCDIYIHNINLVIEIDGPTHYDENNIKNVRTRLRDNIYTRNSIKFVSIPYYEWNKLSSLEEQENYLKKKVA